MSNDQFSDETESSALNRTIKIGNVEMSLDTLTDDEAAVRRWDRFDNRFEDDRRIMVYVRNKRLHTKVSMVLNRYAGNYSDGNWDVFCPDGNKTIAYYLNERVEEGDTTPVMYIIGIDSKVSQQDFDNLNRDIKRMKLIS